MHDESLFADPRFWVAVAFVIFFAVFGRKLWAVLAGMLDQRADAIRLQLSEAQRLRKEAEAMLANAQRQREQALADAQAMIAGAQAEAQRLAQRAAEEAERSAQRRERMATDRIAAAEKAAVDEVRMAAADIAGIASEQVIRNGLTAQADAALIDHAIAGLPSALAPRRAA